MKKQFLVALHAQNDHQIFSELSKILTPGGADGVLLVNSGAHIKSTDEYPNLFDIAIAIKKQYPEKIIGINPVDLLHFEAVNEMIHFEQMEIETALDVLLTNDGGILEHRDSMDLYSPVEEGLKTMRAKYYGGIAFSNLPPAKDLAGVARTASQHFNTIVTSGDEAGLPPLLDKMKTIKSEAGDTPVAIAGGMTAENVGAYMPYADVFIVSTSLLEDRTNQYVYNKLKVEEFAKAVSTN